MKTKLQYYYPNDIPGLIRAVKQKDEDLEDNFLEIKTKTDTVFINSVLGVTTNTTVPIALVPNIDLKISSISHRTSSGTCDIQIKKNTVALTAYSSPVSISTTTTVVSPSAETLSSNDYIECVITNASSLNNIILVINCTQII